MLGKSGLNSAIIRSNCFTMLNLVMLDSQEQMGETLAAHDAGRRAVLI